MISSAFVSIIIPCYKQAHFLDEALESVKMQTYTDWECIIVNDGSPDNTADIALRWTLEDSRFKCLSQNNKGLSKARNAGLEVAIGDFIQFLDADDVIESTKLEESLKKIGRQTKNTIIVTNFLKFENKTDNTKPPYCILNQELLTFRNILYKWDIEFTIPIHCGFFPVDICKKVGFEESLKAKEDWVFWIRIIKEPVKLIFIDKPLAYYRNNPNSMTKTDIQMKNHHLKAFRLLSSYLEQSEYTSLINYRLKYYINKLSDLQKEKQLLKNSNTYQTGKMIKKILRGFGLLKTGRKLFSYIRTFKK